MTGAVIVEQARQYLGVPYFHCGRDRNGLDCLGLLVRVAHDLNLTDADEVDYSTQVDTAYLRRRLEEYCRWVGGPETTPQTGDVLLFAISGVPQHLGIATDVGVIHAYQSGKRVVEHRLDKTWRRRLVGVFRLSGIINEGVG